MNGTGTGEKRRLEHMIVVLRQRRGTESKRERNGGSSG